MRFGHAHHLVAVRYRFQKRRYTAPKKQPSNNGSGSQRRRSHRRTPWRCSRSRGNLRLSRALAWRAGTEAGRSDRGDGLERCQMEGGGQGHGAVHRGLRVLPGLSRRPSTVCHKQVQPSFTHWGSFAEYVGIRQADQNVAALHESMDIATVARLGCRYATSFRPWSIGVGWARANGLLYLAAAMSSWAQ